MKQTITIDQWNEVKLLSPKIPHDMNIGQMVEFLVAQGKNFSMGYDRNPDLWTFVNGKWWANSKGETKDGQEYPELCDALWEAVKEVLEQKESNV